jgi:hypothetical protein
MKTKPCHSLGISCRLSSISHLNETAFSSRDWEMFLRRHSQVRSWWSGLWVASAIGITYMTRRESLSL